MKRWAKNVDWSSVIYKTFKSICVIAIFVGLIYYLESCSDNEEHKRQKSYEEAYNEGYNVGVKESKIFVSAETAEALRYFVEECDGFEYNFEEYVIILGDYYEANKGSMTDEEQEAFGNVFNYCYDADYLTRQIFRGSE